MYLIQANIATEGGILNSMKKKDEDRIQELLLVLLPKWNDHLTKPFKKSLSGGMSLEMYYCIQRLKYLGGTATMTELSQASFMPKHQMTKLVNRLFEYDLITRDTNPKDRRIINITLNDNAQCYLDHFIKEQGKPFRELLEKMSPEEQEVFFESINNLNDIFCRIDH
jgi:DNA-binding MarR family transcriptional regulator